MTEFCDRICDLLEEDKHVTVHYTPVSSDQRNLITNAGESYGDFKIFPIHNVDNSIRTNMGASKEYVNCKVFGIKKFILERVLIYGILFLLLKVYFIIIQISR